MLGPDHLFCLRLYENTSLYGGSVGGMKLQKENGLNQSVDCYSG